MSILLDSMIIDIPTAFPPELQNGVQLFSFPKSEICYDPRIKEAVQVWFDLDETESWISKGMPDEGRGKHVIPTQKQIERYRANTLNAAYFNPNLRGNYALCVDAEAANRIAESVDKIAAMLAASSGMRGVGKAHYKLQAESGVPGFYDTKGRSVEHGPLAEGLRSLICVATHFAKSAQFFYADNTAFNAADFRRHMPATLNRIFSMSVLPKIEVVPQTYTEFATGLLATCYREAASIDAAKAEAALGKYVEMIALAAPGAVPEADLIRDCVPAI